MNSSIPTKKSKPDGNWYLPNHYSCGNDLRRVLLQIVKQLLGPNSSLVIGENNDIKDGAIFLQLINIFSKIPIEEKKNQSIFKTVCDYLNGLGLQDLTKTINFASCEDGKLEELFKLLTYLLFAFHQTESQSQKPRKALNEREASNTPTPSELGNKSPIKLNPSSSRIIRTLSSSDQTLIRDVFEMAKEGKFQELADFLKEASPGSSKGTLEYSSSPNQNLKSSFKISLKSPSMLLDTMRKKEQVIKALRKERAEDEERYSTLLKEKEEANKEIKTLKMKARDNEVIINQFREQSGHENELEELREKVERLTKDNENNQLKLSELRHLKEDNPVLQSENESLRIRLKDCEDKCDRLQGKITNQEDLSKLTTNLKENIESLESELRKSNLQVTYEKEKVEELTKAVESYKEQLADNNVSNMDSSGELVSMVCSPFKCPTASDMQELEEEVYRLNKELSDLKSLKENEQLKLENEKEQLVSELTQFKLNLEDIRNQNETLQEEKNLLDGQISSLSSKFVDVEEKANQLVIECDELVAKKLELETKLNEKDSELEDLRLSLVTSKTDVERIEREKIELKSNLNNTNLLLGEKEVIISQNQTQISSLHLQFQSANDEICELKNLLNEEKSSNDKLKSLLEELQINYSNLEAELTKAKSDHNKELSGLKTLKENEQLMLQNEKEQLFSELTKIKGHLEDICNQKETLQKEKELLDGQIVSLSSNLIGIKEKSHQVVIECDQLVAKKLELETTLNDKDKELEDLRLSLISSKDDVEKVKGEKAELNMKLNEVNLVLGEKDGVISQNQTEITSLHLQLQKTNDEICELKNLLNEEKSSNDTFKFLLEELQINKSNLEAELIKTKSDHNKELSDLKILKENQQLTLQSEKEQLVSELTQIKCYLEDVCNQKETLQKEKELLDGQIVSLSSNLVDIKEKSNQVVIEYDELVAKKLELETMLNDKDKALEDLSLSLVSSKGDVEKLEREKAELNFKLNEVNLALGEKDVVISQNQTQILSLQLQLQNANELKNLAMEEKSSNINFKSLLEELQINKANLEAELIKAKSDLEVSTKALNETSKRDEEHHEAFIELQSCYESLKTGFLELEAKCEKLKEGEAIIKLDNATEVASLNKQIQNLEAIVKENEILITKLEGDKVALSNMFEDCNKNLLSLSNEKDELLKEIGSWDIHIKELRSLKDQLEKEKDDLQTTNADRLNFIQALNGQVTQLEDKIQASIENLNIAKESSKLKEEELKKEIFKLQSENEVLTTENRNLQEVANDRYEKLKNFEEEMMTMVVEEASLTGRKIDSIKQAISKLFEEKDNALKQYNNALIANQNLICDLEKIQKESDIKDEAFKCLEKDLQKKLSELADALEKENYLTEQIENQKRSETSLVVGKDDILREFNDKEAAFLSEINQLKIQLDDCVEKIVTLREETKLLQEENALLTSTVKDLKESNMQQEVIKEELDKESLQYRNRIFQLQFTVGRLNIGVRKLVNELFNKNDTFCNKETEQEDQMNEILKKLKFLKEERDSLFVERNTLTSQIKLLEVELECVKLRVTQMESEATLNDRALKEKNSEINKDADCLKRENQYLVRELEATKESSADKEKELESLRMRISQITEDLEVRREIEGQLLNRINCLKNDEQNMADSLNSTLENIKIDLEKIYLLKQELLEARKKIDELNEQLKAKNEVIVKKEPGTEPAVDELKIEILNLKAERTEFEMLLKVAEEETIRKTNDIYNQEINYKALADEYEKLQMEKVELEKKIQQRNREREELQSCVSEKDEQIISLEKEIRDLMEKFETEKEMLRQANVSLKNELDNLNNRRLSLEYIHQVHEQDYNKLLSKYQTFQAEKASQEELAPLKSTIEELRSKLDKKQLELNSLSIRLEQNQLDHDVAIKNLKSSKTMLAEELALVKSVVNDLQMKIGAKDKDFANSISSFKGQIDSLKKEQIKLEMERNKLAENLKLSESAMSEMKEKLLSFETFKSKVFYLQDENASQKLACDTLEKDKNQLLIENFNILEMNGFLKKTMDDLKARSEKNELELKESLKSLRKEKDVLAKEFAENRSLIEKKLELELKETRKTLTKEKMALVKDLEEARKKHEKLQESHLLYTKNLEILKARSEGRVFELSQTNKLLADEKDKLIKDLKESRQIQDNLREMHNTDVKSLNERITGLQQNLDTKETELKELTKERDTFQKELQAMCEKYEKLQETYSLEVKHLEEKVTSLQRNLNKDESYHKEKDAQTLKVKHLEERISTLQRNLEASQTKVHSLKLSQNNWIIQKNQITEELEKTKLEMSKLAEEKEGLHKEWSQRFNKLSNKNDEVIEDNRKLAQRVVNAKKESQTHKEQILQLGKLLEDTQKSHLKEMKETYEKLDKRDKETTAEIFKLKKKCEIAEESFDEASKRLSKCKELLEEKTKLCENQKEGINHLKFEVVKLKNQISESEEKESSKALSSQVEEYRRRFSCLPKVEMTSELPDYPSLSTRSRKQLDASILSPGNNSSVIRFPCEEEEGHFNDHSKNLSNLKAGICETDQDRLLELQRRNTLCAPHQRTAYPVETQAWSTRKDPTKVVQKNNSDRVEKSVGEGSSNTTERRKSPRFSSVAFEIKNDVAPKPKRKQMNTETNSETPDKRTRANQWPRSRALSPQTRMAASPVGKKRSWKTPLKEFFSPVTPSKTKKFKVPKSRANN